MAREDPQLKVRLPEALKDEIERTAQAAGRSMNAEIVSRLELTFALPPNIPAILQQATAALKRDGQLNRSIRILQATQKSLADLTLLLCDLPNPIDESSQVIVKAARAIATPMAENPDAITAEKLLKWYPDLHIPLNDASDDE
jgi:hypothetical protein